MRADDYQRLAERTEAACSVPKFDDRDTRLLHAHLGLSSEVGEIGDALKRYFFYGQPLDETNLIEEAGDVAWYLALLCNALEVSMDEVLEKNIAKLKARFPEKYSDTLAAEENRNREAERQVLSSPVANGQVATKPQYFNEVELMERGGKFWDSSEDYDHKPLNDFLTKHIQKPAIELARRIADRMDGQERTHALKEIERFEDAQSQG